MQGGIFLLTINLGAFFKLTTNIRGAFFSLTTNVRSILPTDHQCKEHSSH
ncbi:unnamed protein product [Staurois parvus]|uniref:Uncharacterized protein n=1 Tax=Staurois parvus TaxID=386267 RepID=A0ABN9DQA9_9NEOB|nr:unnamed protein product [Staurois parvus]